MESSWDSTTHTPVTSGPLLPFTVAPLVCQKHRDLDEPVMHIAPAPPQASPPLKKSGQDAGPCLSRLSGFALVLVFGMQSADLVCVCARARSLSLSVSRFLPPFQPFERSGAGGFSQRMHACACVRLSCYAVLGRQIHSQQGGSPPLSHHVSHSLTHGPCSHMGGTHTHGPCKM